MKKINLRIAELRHKKKLTQQELADMVGVSFQTISKWENGGAMPDITYLPVLAEYFDVSVDQLIGIVPLNEEAYIASKAGTKEFWESKSGYLLRTGNNMWNNDYMEFLITKVWKIDRPVKVLDCGCGFGCLGLLIMPYLPEGSKYTGIDMAENLIEMGKKLFESNKLQGEFINADVYNYDAKDSFDVVICQSVLRHLDSPESFIRRMIEFAKNGAYIICIDSNREFECDGLYIEGMDYFRLCEHAGMEKHWRTELEQQGRDYAAAIRNAHLMRKLGLKEVDVRMNDRVDFVTPQREDYEQRKRDFVEYNDWNRELTKEEKEESIQYLLTHGITRKEATDFCERNTEIATFFQENPDAGYTFVRGTMISYGKK